MMGPLRRFAHRSWPPVHIDYARIGWLVPRRIRQSADSNALLAGTPLPEKIFVEG